VGQPLVQLIQTAIPDHHLAQVQLSLQQQLQALLIHFVKFQSQEAIPVSNATMVTTLIQQFKDAQL
jgi:hypothetical protein